MTQDRLKWRSIRPNAGVKKVLADDHDGGNDDALYMFENATAQCIAHKYYCLFFFISSSFDVTITRAIDF